MRVTPPREGGPTVYRIWRSADRSAIGTVLVIIEGVDPRDTQWEVDRPVYRVYFWHQPPAPAGAAQEQVMWHCDEYRLIETTGVEEVLDWAHSGARPDQTFTLYLEHHDAHRSGLVRLLGMDPTSAT